MHRAPKTRAAKLRRALFALLAAVASAVTAVALPTAAGAAGVATYGHIDTAYQYRNGSIHLTGWAFDRHHPRLHPGVCLIIRGRCVKVLYPHQASPRFDRQHHTRGAHLFSINLRPRRPGVMIILRRVAAPANLDRATALSPGTRVVRVARREVGDRYRYGGSSPRTGFDCSGYTMYSYRNGHTAGLPHNAESQRHSSGMHRIARRTARPGDLVFYMSGGSAYHVAIYAGHGYQYSATDPQQGVEHDRIHDRNVIFGTDWHR